MVLLVVLAIGCDGTTPEPSPTPQADPTPTARPATPPTAEPRAKATDGLIANDGHTLWASPTAGEAIDLSMVPDGSDLILYLRPADLLASEEGRRVWRALGPAGEAARVVIEGEASKPLDQTTTVLVGVTAGDSYEAVQTTLTSEPQPSEELPLIQREIEQLLETTDADRHATLIFSPRFLLGDGGSMLEGPWEPLRQLLLAQARDDWSAAALSLHLDDGGRLYWELRLLKSDADPETRVAKQLNRQAQRWSDDLAPVVAEGSWSPYSVAVIERSPAMLRVLGEYARRGVDGRQAIVNGYAPAVAAHQLLLAGERIVAELATPPVPGLASAGSAAPDNEFSIAERLRRPVSISFPRESLEAAVAILSDALATPITIVGRDLQLEGITRNQMLGLDVTEKPAGEVLVEMLRRANPDTLATGLTDERQKLVYVVRGNSIAITTRNAAAKRNEKLPAPFTE